MYEIELKAHVKDREKVSRALDFFAEYAGSLVKRDTYYRLPAAPSGTETPSLKCVLTNAHFKNGDTPSCISCRIRKTVYEKTNETKIAFTYKRKELRKDADGVAIEVNDEKECIISDTDAIESFIEDAGGFISHVKEKIVKEWYAETDAGEAHIELCTVPPLGDFLEIEVLAKDDAQTESAKRAIMRIFGKCGIDEHAVESRYYNDMIDEALQRTKAAKNGERGACAAGDGRERNE